MHGAEVKYFRFMSIRTNRTIVKILKTIKLLQRDASLYLKPTECKTSLIFTKNGVFPGSPERGVTKGLSHSLFVIRYGEPLALHTIFAELFHFPKTSCSSLFQSQLQVRTSMKINATLFLQSALHRKLYKHIPRLNIFQDQLGYNLHPVSLSVLMF